MVTRSGRYCGTLLKGHLRVTKGGHIPHTIFNMVVDAVICYWVTMVEGEESVLVGFRRAVQWLAELFYTGNSLLALPRLAWIQVGFGCLDGFV